MKETIKNNFIEVTEKQHLISEIQETGYTQLRTENLNVFIGENHVLKDINLTIPDKSITCIIGPSGCGKTTLLRSFNRMHDDSAGVRVEGKLFFDGQNIYEDHVDVTSVRKMMGLLAQRPCPLPMSIYENVAYGPRIHRFVRRKERHQMVIKYLQYVGLWDEVKGRIHSSASGLSVGQQQRLCLARGLAVEPKIILGDEATSALDPISTRKIEELFLELKQKYTIVLVTHTLRQAKRIADYIAFMYAGKLIEFGTTHQVFTNPAKSLTRDYIDGSFG